MNSNETRTGGWLMPMRSLFLRRFRDCESGAAAVEFAFMAPIFLVVLFGLIEFGRLYWLDASLRYAVEEVGRDAMAEYTRTYWTDTTVTDSALIDAVKTSSEASLPTSVLGYNFANITFTVTVDTSGNPDFLVLEGDYDFSFLVPFVPAPAMTLHAETRVPMLKSDT